MEPNISILPMALKSMILMVDHIEFQFLITWCSATSAAQGHESHVRALGLAGARSLTAESSLGHQAQNMRVQLPHY